MEFVPDIFGKISFSGEAIADLVFFLIAGFTAVISVVFFFHWRKYGLGGTMFALAEFVYLGVSVVLLAIAFFSLN